MVPSAMPPPMPFIDDVAGAAVVYMVANPSRPQPCPWPGCRTDGAGARKRPPQRVKGGRGDSDGDESTAGAVLIRRCRREFVACRPVAQGKLRTPLPGHYGTLKVREKVEADG